MNTKKVFFSISDIKILSAQHILKEAGIETFVINKKDSVYAGVLGGKIELYVPSHQEDLAKKVLEENDMLD